ncbi:MAG: type I polyketide synthase [Pirellulaceae bacterium]|nr:type I polyketide synthase [Pirellulaceae bacterium]
MRQPGEMAMDGDRSRPAGRQEPLAIVGIGCRFPGGADTWQEFWRLLEEGRDAIEETPADRWSLQKFYAQDPGPGKTQSRWGGYVRNIDQFDPQLFGIAPREAAAMDPQQRMLLEVAWRAIEDGGQAVENIAGQNVSVFVGISSFDYAVAGLSSEDRGVISPYSNTGGSSSIAANRISYCFDLRGPSVAVDTACSSSLVAVHMACESIWNGDSKMALAGGVNALILPDFYVAFSQLGVLAPDGRCKTFDAKANGYVRSEGAGMVLLKPLAEAMRDGDCIYAVIRATALNQDGRTPGLTVPSEAAQAALVRTACERAGIAPAEVQYVEAHGTGTAVGDPIEANALASVLSEGRPKNQPCWVGSVKTNIGHLEAGAGMASLIKVALALHHQRIPAQLHFENPNPAIDFERLGLRVPTSIQPWHRQPNRTRLAGINGFGYGGANAHIIVEESPVGHKQSVAPENPRQFFKEATPATKQTPVLPKGSPFELPVILPLSARSQPALSELARDWANWFESFGSELHIAEAAAFAAHRRSHLECRKTVCGTTREELIEKLRSLEMPRSRTRAGEALKIAFVCAGQGPQWWAMGRNLLSYCPAFREVIDSCGREFARYGKWSLIEELSRSEDSSRMQQTHIAQPSLFAIQVGLAAVWKSWGIEPAVVVGHSVGEIAAAYISGALTFGDACAVAFHRGRTMDLASSRGAMLAVGLSAAEIRPMLANIQDEVAIAAINGPSSITLSGAVSAIEQLFQQLTAANVFCRRLKVEYAFHSSHMDPVCDELLRSLSSIRPKKNHTELISTVTGKLIDGAALDAEYWWQNVRHSVLFADAMQGLAERDCDVALELGPHPVLAFSIAECFQAHGKQIQSLPSLHRELNDLQCLANSLGELYSLGADVRWSGYYTAPTRKLLVPNYPFQRTRCWSESRQTRLARGSRPVHPLLGESQYGPRPSWQGRIDLRLQSYLSDHCVRGVCVYPAAAIIEGALAAAREVSEVGSVQLDRLRFHNPCTLADGRAQWIETRYHDDRRQIEMQFRATDDDEWMLLFTAEVSTLVHDRQQARNAELHYAEAFDSARLYSYCKLLGLEYGPLFRGVVRGSRKDGAAWLEVNLNAATQSDAYGAHPALLDACFHGMIAADADFDHTLGGLYLPAEIKRLRFIRPLGAHVRCHVRITSKTQQRMLADIDVFDVEGRWVAAIEGFESQRVHGGGKPLETVADLVYKYDWVKQDLNVEQSASNLAGQRWIVFQDNQACGTDLVPKLKKRGIQVSQVFAGTSFTFDGVSRYTVNPESIADFRQLLTRHAHSGQSVANVVYLWGLDVPAGKDLDNAALDRSTHLTTLAPMHLIQAWESLPSPTQANLAMVTQAAQATIEQTEPVAIAQAPLIGFGRVIVSEYGPLRGKLIDLESNNFDSLTNGLLSELLATDSGADGGEDEVAWRRGARWVHRFVQAKALPLATDVAGQLASRLQVGASSGVEELRYRSCVQAPLAANEVEIEVLATGLNFSDVMKALDLYPGLPDGPVALGAECSGRITRVGVNVSSSSHPWRLGDEVVAIAPGSFGTHVRVACDLIARKPKSLSHEQAAAIPIAFLTAEYALNQCARIRAGESVLIHAASGGVGLAAMQLALAAGAIVYATAGNEEKRAYVRQLGARMTMDSRTVGFADLILEATSSEEQPGVDVILNSLPGEAISKGLAILKTGGRFLEIGKRDIYNDASLGLYVMRNNLAFFAIDLDQLFKQQPAHMGAMLRDLVSKFDAGELKPVLTKCFAADDTRAAFRFMQQGKHIGKVSVSYNSKPTEVLPGEYPPIEFRKDASYWIAGGLGGFGMQVAQWMASRGAGSLVLSGRRQLSPAQAKEIAKNFAPHGTQVSILPTDITNPASVATTLQIIDQTLPPLRGVFHTAMILEDRMLVDLDRATLERVLRPKVLGGWNLHQQTLNRELDHFVLFSSLSSVFGHAGQANYSAANALLDSLAHYRRSLNLPALAMNWGHLGEVGYLAEREQLGQRLERQGVLSFTVKQALECLEYAMQLQERQLSVLRIDWTVWRGLGITNRVSPRFAHLLRTSHNEENGQQNQLASADQLRAATSAERGAMVEQLLRYKVGSLLGMANEQIQRDRSLIEMGLDSLMAVEMRNWVEAKLEIGLPIATLMRSASLKELVEKVSEIVASTGPDVAAKDLDTEKNSSPLTPITGQQASELLEQLPALADGEVSQLLERLLRGQGN